MLLIVFLLIAIPLFILGGVGKGIDISGIMNNLPNIIPQDKKLDDGPKIKVMTGKDKKIVEMPLEDYIRGVVSAEMNASFEIEALKAQAIAARTFAVGAMREYGGNGRNHEGADICSETHCQVWMSKEDRFKNWKASDAEANWKKITEAVDSTKGMVLVSEGKLASAVKYFSASGGKTENSINVFGYSASYLVSVESPEKGTPNDSTTKVIKKEDFVKKVKAMNKDTKISAKNLANQIKIIDYTEGGRVKTIKIGDKTFSGIDVRWGMELKSASFSINVTPTSVVFNVRGSGHGVGMSQWGANVMAKDGAKYDAILKHYYKGIEIEQINEIFKNKNS